MLNLILTAIGYCIWLPWLVTVIRTPFSRTLWHRQVLALSWGFFLSAFCFEPVSIYFGFGFVCVSFLICCYRERPAFHITPLAIVSLAYWVWYVLSLIWSVAPLRGIQFLIDTLPLVVLCWLPCWIRIEQESLARILRIFITSATIWACVCVIGVLSTCVELHISLFDWPILQKTTLDGTHTYRYLFRSYNYFHPSYNCLVLCTAVGCATYLYKDKGWLYKGGIVFMAIMVTMITLWVQSRMGLLFFCVMWIHMLVQWLPTTRMRWIAISLITLLFVVGVGTHTDTLRAIGEDPVRDYLTQATLDYIHIKPWGGAGAGSLNPVEMTHTLGLDWWPHIGMIKPEWTVANWSRKTSMLPHNQFLADWAHGGIMAFLLCITLYISLIYECIKEKNMTTGMFVLIFIIMSLLEPTLFITKGMYLFGAMATLVHRPDFRKDVV